MVVSIVITGQRTAAGRRAARPAMLLRCRPGCRPGRRPGRLLNLCSACGAAKTILGAGALALQLGPRVVWSLASRRTRGHARRRTGTSPSLGHPTIKETAAAAPTHRLCVARSLITTHTRGGRPFRLFDPWDVPCPCRDGGVAKGVLYSGPGLCHRLSAAGGVSDPLFNRGPHPGEPGDRCAANPGVAAARATLRRAGPNYAACMQLKIVTGSWRRVSLQGTAYTPHFGSALPAHLQCILMLTHC